MTETQLRERLKELGRQEFRILREHSTAHNSCPWRS